MGVTNVSHDNYVQMTNDGYTEIDKAAQKLAEALAKFGFRGEIRVDLKVELHPGSHCPSYTDIQKRSSSFSFRR